MDSVKQQKMDMDAVEPARESEFLTLSLPPLAEDDPFFAGKKVRAGCLSFRVRQESADCYPLQGT